MPANLSQLPLFNPPDGDPPIPHAAAATRAITLPFQRAEEIDVDRASRILQVSKGTVVRILRRKLIRAYVFSNRWRIEYASLVEYCDHLCVAHQIPRRTAQRVPGRRLRDADLLPFPFAETITLAEVASRFDCGYTSVLHLIQEGKLAAYQVLVGERACPWRIHTLSVDRYMLSLRAMASAKPR